jgi:hypothetical protein
MKPMISSAKRDADGFGAAARSSPTRCPKLCNQKRSNKRFEIAGTTQLCICIPGYDLLAVVIALVF